jgi:hypothetical protein
VLIRTLWESVSWAHTPIDGGIIVVLVVTLARWLPRALDQARENWKALLFRPDRVELTPDRRQKDRRSGRDRRSWDSPVNVERRVQSDRRVRERRRQPPLVAVQ